MLQDVACAELPSVADQGNISAARSGHEFGEHVLRFLQGARIADNIPPLSSQEVPANTRRSE